VIWADSIRGPWSDPIDLKNRRIDPGHAVGPDGTRYLFLSGGYLVRLAGDGLSIVGDEKKIYDGWQYPKDWIVQAFAQEGPKILRKGEYYYQVLAEGGTAGPPTGHMIVAARSKSIEGPWENSPYNPIIRTVSAAQRWSKGHGTLVEGPDRQLVGRLPRIRKRVLHPWPADAAPADRVAGRRMVPGDARSGRADSETRADEYGPAWFCFVRRLLDQPHGSSVGLLQGRRRGPRPLSV
jgi:beta-xylosidase